MACSRVGAINGTGISRSEIVEALVRGEIIETYEKDRPYSSFLFYFQSEAPLHVVAALDTDSQIGHVITAYRPDPLHFEIDFKTRRPTT